MTEKLAKNAVALGVLKVEYVPIDDLKPNEYNPNRQSEHDFELLCKSIDEDGMTQPVVALRASRVIVDGEHRWRACKTLGHAEIPVVFTDMTPAQARIATLRHNRARGSEDVELAAAVLKDLVRLGATDWLKDSLMMDAVEIDAFLQAVDDQDGFSTDEAAAMAELPDDELRAAVRNEGGEIDEHASVSVQDVIRAREVRMRETRGTQESEQKAHEQSVYRMRLVYTGEQSRIIKAALGTRPIERLLEICRERAALL